MDGSQTGLLHQNLRIASPPQDIRAVFDLMPTDTADEWSVIATRLGAVPEAVRGYVETLRAGVSAGVVPAQRQVREVVTQIGRYTSDRGFFAEFAAEAAPSDGQLPASLARELSDAAGAARVAYEELADVLAGETTEKRRYVDQLQQQRHPGG